MKYDGVIIKFGELFLKGRNRFRFIDRALQTAKNKLVAFDGVIEYTKFNDHINIALNGADHEEVVKQLNFVFGFQIYQLYTKCETTMESIKETTLAVIKEIENDGRTIKIIAKRGYKQFPMNSPQIAQEIGIFIADNSTIGVDLDNPQLKVKVIVRKEASFVVAKEVKASGGLPIGVNGRSLLMLSGGLDSPVAGYLMMKRGLSVDGLHFDSPPYTSPRARQKVFDLAEKMAHYMPNGRFITYIVPFTKLQKAIFENIPDSYGMTIMRRMMYRISEGVALRTGSLLISNGESLGQVASQTPHSMFAIDSTIEMPVVRPVACMDKIEIMDIASKIDTYDISIRPYEDCCTVFLPKNPAIAPSKEKCIKYEAKFDWEPYVQECIRNVEKVVIEAGKPMLVDADTSDEICALL